MPDVGVLPAQAIDPLTGNTMSVMPDYQAPGKPVVTWTRGGGIGAPFAGTFSVTTTNYVGSYFLEIDTNSNGSYDDPEDISVPFTAVDATTTRTFVWDGRDSVGRVVTDITAINSARVRLQTTDELHMVLVDSEHIDGQQWEKIIGAPGTMGMQSLAWDDTLISESLTTRYGDVSPAMVATGAEGYGKTGPTHSWGADNGVNVLANYWGDNSNIDTWTFTNFAAADDPELYGTSVDLTVPRLTIRTVPTTTLITAPGEPVHYDVIVSNVAAMTVDDVEVTVANFSGAGPAPVVTCPASVLVGGAHMVCTATYTTRVADVMSGRVLRLNTSAAGVSTDGVSGGAYAVNAAGDFVNPDGVPLPPDQAPQGVAGSTIATAGITVHKAVSLGGAEGVAGDTATYTFKVKNTGTVPVSALSVLDRLEDLSAITCSGSSIAPGATVTCTATYVLTQLDVDLGGVDNAATASTTASGGTPVHAIAVDDLGRAVPSPEAPTDPTKYDDHAKAHLALVPAPGLSLVKTATPTSITDAQPGELVTYQFAATNTGDVTLTDVTLDDPMLADESLGAWPGVPGTLAPGQSVSGTGSYRLVKADIDAGELVNTATIAGTDPDGERVSHQARATVALPANAQITLTKIAPATPAADVAVAGNLLQYVFTVANTGNVSVNQVAVADPMLGAVTFGTWPGAPNVLAPGQSVVATGTYTLSPADVTAGTVHNQATATGLDPSGTSVTSTAEATWPAPPTPSVVVTKTGDPDRVVNPAPGAPVTYQLLVANNGNVELTDLALVDPLLAGLVVPATLAPGASTTVTAPYALTAADINAGVRPNTATASGVYEGTTVSDDAAFTVVLPAGPGLVLTKTVDAAQAAGAMAGDEVGYTFAVTNNGNVTVSAITITDGVLDSLVPGPWPGAAGVLAPGESATAAGVYTMTQADLDVGYVVNHAQALGTTPTGGYVSAVAQTTATTTFHPELELTKTGPGLHPDAQVGDEVDYTFTVTNTGTVTMDAVQVHDELIPGGVDYASWPGVPEELAPGQSVTATAVHVLTQEDIDAGFVTNHATAEGFPPRSTEATSTADDWSFDIPADPGLELVTTYDVAFPAAARPGDEVFLRFAVTNTGNVTVFDVDLTDTLVGLVTVGCAWAWIAPGEEVICEGLYILTDQDMDAGQIVSDATAQGRLPTPVAGDDPDAEPTDHISAHDMVTITFVPADPDPDGDGDGDGDGGDGDGDGDDKGDGYDDGYKDGYDDGHGDGYKDGHGDGYGDGYDDGHGDGYDDGYGDGYDKGHGDGHGDGYKDGHGDGYKQGHGDGYNEGYDKGHGDGYTDGHTEGYLDGYRDGHADGYRDGYDSGYRAGYDGGYRDGYDGGYAAGYANGYRDGYDAKYRGTGSQILPSTPLGYTGASGTVALVTAALGLLLAGVGAVAVSRRRTAGGPHRATRRSRRCPLTMSSQVTASHSGTVHAPTTASPMEAMMSTLQPATQATTSPPARGRHASTMPPDVLPHPDPVAACGRHAGAMPPDVLPHPDPVARGRHASPTSSDVLPHPDPVAACGRQASAMPDAVPDKVLVSVAQQASPTSTDVPDPRNAVTHGRHASAGTVEAGTVGVVQARHASANAVDAGTVSTVLGRHAVCAAAPAGVSAATPSVAHGRRASAARVDAVVSPTAGASARHAAVCAVPAPCEEPRDDRSTSSGAAVRARHASDAQLDAPDAVAPAVCARHIRTAAPPGRRGRHTSAGHADAVGRRASGRHVSAAQLDAGPRPTAPGRHVAPVGKPAVQATTCGRHASPAPVDAGPAPAHPRHAFAPVQAPCRSVRRRAPRRCATSSTLPGRAHARAAGPPPRTSACVTTPQVHHVAGTRRGSRRTTSTADPRPPPAT
ncbi:MAG: hypothetical protein FWE61_05265 [Micrococcales bacterium]|nr:hypothetical protein [Micrococcales bacterium]